MQENRKRLAKWIKAQLIGPSPYMYSQSEDEGAFLKGINPVERFPCGAIYPVHEGAGEDPAGTEGDEKERHDDKASSEDGKEDAPVRRYTPPSSIGVSFCLASSCTYIEANYFASHYEYDNAKHYWVRYELEEQQKFFAPTHDYDSYRKEIWGGRARIDILWRKHDAGWIVTVSFCNNSQMLPKYSSDVEFARDLAEKTLFEARLEVRVSENDIALYPSVDKSLLDEEEQELELQYRDKKLYAIGHGTGVDWEISKNGMVIFTESIPTAEVPQVTANLESKQVLELRYLANALNNKSHTIASLAEFVQDYGRWIEEQEKKVSSFPKEDHPVGSRITTKMREVEKRMHSGIKLLSSDNSALLAFSLANRAILNQMEQGGKQKGKKPKSDYAWRPFQLAFLLTVLESATDNDSEHRDLVDLIWFPTGGGKTEAYFGLIAYVVLLRRLRHPATSGGTTVLMRYTLRLLTKDQYLRAARLICALELIRKGRDDLGDTAISIGLWVGGEASPNSFADAHKLVCDAKNAKKEKIASLVINACPWCGAEFTISSGSYQSGAHDFHFQCSNKACDFGVTEEPIPCNVVDEHLYLNPPTLIIGTVDKFARMPWEERIENFFGKSGNRPPELIIQDELHLISGALGTVSGLYEAAIDSIIRLRGLYPKYVASTATIRTAEGQIKRLYGRKAAVFPPPGITCDDSYFAKIIPLSKKPGRLYLGYFAPQLNRQKSLAPLAATLLAAPVALFTNEANEELLLDAWWTNIVYHGSLKGLASSHMSFDTDVRDRLQMMIAEIKACPLKKFAEAEQDIKLKDRLVEKLEQRVLPLFEELTSHKTADQNAETFSKLKIAYPQNGCLDAALATNMVSVGLDVARLALMVINGQPLTTAEYIQASSRVGRGGVPGVVFVNYYRDQTRSLSHYEQFKAYHEAFYRYVEPTSVTPFTWQARKKALHAAIVSVIRHGVTGCREASDFSAQSPELQKALAVLKGRCADAAETLTEDVLEHIDSLTREWESKCTQCSQSKRAFKYFSSGDRAFENLLCNFDDTIQGLWPTLQSMRDVEDTALLKEIWP